MPTGIDLEARDRWFSQVIGISPKIALRTPGAEARPQIQSDQDKAALRSLLSKDIPPTGATDLYFGRTASVRGRHPWQGGPLAAINRRVFGADQRKYVGYFSRSSGR